GSGGLAGKGFRHGTQGQLRFLPVAHNDFIFSVLAEEQGFAGVLVALGLYLFVILRALEAARLAKDRLGSYLVLGVLASFTFQVVYNVTMSAGLAPVKGLTLPLMSYGGSSMIATLAGFGLVLNVRMRRFTNLTFGTWDPACAGLPSGCSRTGESAAGGFHGQKEFVNDQGDDHLLQQP